MSYIQNQRIIHNFRGSFPLFPNIDRSRMAISCFPVLLYKPLPCMSSSYTILVGNPCWYRIQGFLHRVLCWPCTGALCFLFVSTVSLYIFTVFILSSLCTVGNSSFILIYPFIFYSCDRVSHYIMLVRFLL